MIKTDRLTLRAPVMADASEVARHADDAEISKWLLMLPHPYSVSDAQEYITTQMAVDKPGQNYLICLGGEAVGAIGTIGEFGYWLGRTAWGQGLATEAAQAVLARHFEVDGWDLASSHAQENDRSRRVLEKCGFQPTGKITRRVGKYAGQDHMHRMMRLTRAEWAAL